MRSGRSGRRRRSRRPRAAYYGLEEGQETSYFFQRLVTDMLTKLVANGCVRQTGKTLSPTPLGKIASAQYLDYATIYHLHTALSALDVSEMDDETSMKALLAIIAGCAEFGETPLRPHEGKTNASLAAAVRFSKLERQWKWDTHGAKMKTSILLQIHLGRIQAPSSECYNDLRVVLDNLPRITGAMVDIAALLGRVPLVHACVSIAQGMLFGKWPDRLGWLELPHLSAADVPHLPPIAKAADAVWPKRLSTDKVRELQAALQQVPHVDVRVTQQPSTKKDGIDVTVSVRVTNESLLPSVVSTRYVKPRPRLLYALLVDTKDTSKLLGMVHLPYRRSATKTLTLRGAPERAIDIQVVSNASAVVLVPSAS